MVSNKLSSWWAVCGWHSLCPSADAPVKCGMEFAGSTHQTLDVSAMWTWLPAAMGYKLTFAVGLLAGFVLGCATGTILRSYFVLFQLAFAIAVLGLVWVI